MRNDALAGLTVSDVKIRINRRLRYETERTDTSLTVAPNKYQLKHCCYPSVCATNTHALRDIQHPESTGLHSEKGSTWIFGIHRLLADRFIVARNVDSKRPLIVFTSNSCHSAWQNILLGYRRYSLSHKNSRIGWCSSSASAPAKCLRQNPKPLYMGFVLDLAACKSSVVRGSVCDKSELCSGSYLVWVTPQPLSLLTGLPAIFECTGPESFENYICVADYGKSCVLFDLWFELLHKNALVIFEVLPYSAKSFLYSHLSLF